ncbi:hypothetical protein GCM10010954_32800 [Halobacillus andaensis]|uniref:CDP-Glycerol:Poly(Glycerophosphate) glycerophosphotransferase n=1 Tax=Halobacillus andaensis TaxID=1176239 RepID=A0A917EY25_HALAA|nr:CDP-glycerol glycerophosphotransferase family protein [Halobacillus andaensis]MBP2005384.1 CDP-glycerol glycerophosphotransferase (TagB/SpsB family) [Halobacillus andaensis]GGF31073.1 hypothetical protein GCM10010954_32800 [Halobacillus andaensis]
MKRIKTFIHKIKENVSSEESEINSKDIKVENVQFEGDFWFLTLSEKVSIKKAHPKIVIKKMKNSEEIGEVVVTGESRAEINVKDHSLLDHEKCAFYLRIGDEETRLKPSTSLSSNLKDSSYAHELEDYLVIPYITVKGNFSVKIIERFTLNQTKDLPHGLSDIQYDTNQPIIKGWLFADDETKLNCEIIMKKRGSNLIYHLPTTVLKNEWQAIVDLPSFQPSKGTWDYYLRVNEKKNYRIQLENNIITNQIEAQTYQTKRESRWNTFYMTKNGALSSKIKSATVQMLNVQAKVIDKYTVNCSGTLDGDFLNQDHEIDQAKVFIEQRNTGKSHLLSIDISKEEDRTLPFNFVLDYREIISNLDDGKFRWDVYLQIPYHEEEAVYRFKLDAEALAYQSRIEIENETINQVYMYSTVNQQLSIVMKDLSIERNVESFSFSNHQLNLSGHAYLDTVEWVAEKEVVRNLILRERESEQEYVLPLEGKYNNLEKFGYRYHFSGFEVQINLDAFLPLSKEMKKVFDLYVQFNYKGITKERRLGCEEFTYYKDDVLDRSIISRERDYDINYLTYTPSGNLKVETNCIPSEAMKYLSYENNETNEEGKEDIWLIGERSNTAQDTGYHFFKFCRENYPDKQVYYAIDSNSKDLSRIKSLGNVVDIGSIEHYKIASSATAFIGSHDLEYFLPAKGIEFNSYKQGKRIFLQHGVLGRKNVEYHKDYYKYPFHLFCVSSLPEKNLVEKKLGYNKDEVEITGLTRFDSLLNNKQSKKSILFIPTWRDWLLNENDFLASDYYKRYKGMLQNERLHDVLKEYRVELNFFPHYRMQPFVDHFEIKNDNINVIKLGERTVQDLLLENSLMITDYSSVSFDFNYMSKPVVFYHFDRDSFFRKGILRPVEETFLGDICYSEDELVQRITEYIKGDFTEKEEFANKKHLIFSEIDKNNCQRVYNRIQEI